MATFERRTQPYFGNPGTAFRVTANPEPRELEVLGGAIAREMDKVIGEPGSLMGLPSDSGDVDADRDRRWGLWAPEDLVSHLEARLEAHGHLVVDA